ncbi:GCN5-related N-acetyltransferase [Shewanella sp. ANA-3]|uniref:GNAT family N-acetyltransferase n=1 Tax=unclassified Shewanella TaxID=196818 RepID=UPI00005DE780|nr:MULTISPECIES: GNAT family N-acetyltransferase [unclassified Shewanella]ABK48529.1 GCN5-related N-acetyltransferase [Shewanella sp. ANA-3]MDH0448926.1 GNAT family N-acetyltransferase [Shewanella sp. GD04112]
MLIRAATTTDIEAISALITQLTQVYIAPTCTDVGAETLVNAMSVESVAHYFALGYQYHVAINETGELVGVVGMKDNSHLYHLFVADIAKGQGLSRQLWELAKAECLAKGNPGTFTVNSAVNALPVYQHFGFVAQSDIRERGGIRDIPMQLVL